MDAYDDRIKNIKSMDIEPAKSKFMQFSLSTIESNKILEEINMYVAKRNLSRLIKYENRNSLNEHFLYYDGNKFLYISPTKNICLTKEGLEGIDLIEGKDFVHMKYSHSWQYKLLPQSGYYENVWKLVDKLIDIFDKKKEAQKSLAHMHYLKDSNDSKEGNKMYMLPRDHSVDVRIFETLVDARNLSASYKLFWLAGILEEIKQGNNEIAFRKIVCRMLELAWDLVLQNNLNFGSDDKISDIVKLLHNEYNTVEDAGTNRLLEFLEKPHDAKGETAYRSLYKYVPYRLLSPFFNEQLIGVSENMKNKVIADSSLQIKTALYKIYKKDEKITVNKEWFDYIYSNQDVISCWLEQKIINYLQKRNTDMKEIPFTLATQRQSDIVATQTPREDDKNTFMLNKQKCAENEISSIIELMDYIEEDGLKKDRFRILIKRFNESFSKNISRQKNIDNDVYVWGNKIVFPQNVKLEDIFARDSWMGSVNKFFESKNLQFIYEINEEVLSELMFYNNVGYKKFKETIDILFRKENKEKFQDVLDNLVSKSSDVLAETELAEQKLAAGVTTDALLDVPKLSSDNVQQNNLKSDDTSMSLDKEAPKYYLVADDQVCTTIPQEKSINEIEGETPYLSDVCKQDNIEAISKKIYRLTTYLRRNQSSKQILSNLKDEFIAQYKTIEAQRKIIEDLKENEIKLRENSIRQQEEAISLQSSYDARLEKREKEFYQQNTVILAKEKELSLKDELLAKQDEVMASLMEERASDKCLIEEFNKQQRELVENLQRQKELTLQQQKKYEEKLKSMEEILLAKEQIIAKQEAELKVLEEENADTKQLVEELVSMKDNLHAVINLLTEGVDSEMLNDQKLN